MPQEQHWFDPAQVDLGILHTDSPMPAHYYTHREGEAMAVELQSCYQAAFLLPIGWTGLSLSQRRLYMDTWMTQPTRRLSGERPTCVYGPTGWPCKMQQPRWLCYSSLAVGCPRWLCHQPSTVTIWLRPRLGVRKTCAGPRWAPEWGGRVAGCGMGKGR